MVKSGMTWERNSDRETETQKGGDLVSANKGRYVEFMFADVCGVNEDDLG